MTLYDNGGKMVVDYSDFKAACAERDALRAAINYALLHVVRNAGNKDSAFSYLWERDWTEFERRIEEALK